MRQRKDRYIIENNPKHHLFVKEHKDGKWGYTVAVIGDIREGKDKYDLDQNFIAIGEQDITRFLKILFEIFPMEKYKIIEAVKQGVF